MHFMSREVISLFPYLGLFPKSLPVSSHTQNAQTCQHKLLNDLNSELQHTDCDHATKQIAAAQWRHSSSCLRPSETYNTICQSIQNKSRKTPKCNSAGYSARIYAIKRLLQL